VVGVCALESPEYPEYRMEGFKLSLTLFFVESLRLKKNICFRIVKRCKLK